MIEQKPNQKNEREFESHFLSFCRSFQNTILVKCLSSFFLSFPFFRHPPNIIEDLQYPGPFIRLMGKLPTRISKQHFATWWDVEELSFSFNDGHDSKRALSMMTHWAILQMREINCWTIMKHDEKCAPYASLFYPASDQFQAPRSKQIASNNVELWLLVHDSLFCRFP